ncbi:MAG: hypothetical protein KH028_04155 [Oscillospiraceae bacterium]|jgi:hypothetical protein|nr:hypothetical protein [Oscillospiraceae bacterium]
MQQSKWADRFFMIGFLGFLALALSITLMQPKTSWSYYENRTLAQPAELSVETVLDGTFPASVEPVLQDHAAGRNTLMQLSAWTDLHLFHRPVVNQVVPADGMLLGWNPYETPNPAAITAQAEHMAEELARLRDVVEAYGGYFCYTAVPGQYAYYSESYPDFLNNREAYTALEVPALTQAMAKRGMDLLDMGAVLDTAGNPIEYYSTADYHYQFGGAYLTYRAILERLNTELDTELAILDGHSLTVETLPNPYLGSRGRKLFGLEDCGERLTIGLPKDPVLFTRFDNGRETAPMVYALPATGAEEVLYSLYMGGDIGETVIQTHRPELPSILIYGDSFTNPVECLAYYSFDEMRSLDLRHYLEMSLADYIRLYQPDIVVGIRDYEALLSTDYNGRPFAVQP